MNLNYEGAQFNELGMRLLVIYFGLAQHIRNFIGTYGFLFYDSRRISRARADRDDRQLFDDLPDGRHVRDRSAARQPNPARTIARRILKKTTAAEAQRPLRHTLLWRSSKRSRAASMAVS